LLAKIDWQRLPIYGGVPPPPVGQGEACREKADKKIGEILNDDQKKKLDQLEQEPHSELRGSLKGTTPPPPRAPQN